MEKGQQHPKDFPGGHPPQYYPGLARLNFGVQMGSGAFNAVWPLTKYLIFISVPRGHSARVYSDYDYGSISLLPLPP